MHSSHSAQSGNDDEVVINQWENGELGVVRREREQKVTMQLVEMLMECEEQHFA